MCPLLEVENLKVSFGEIEAVRNVSFDVGASESVALVGESGCGKTVTALAILRLLGKCSLSGSIRFAGRELLPLDEETMCRYRGASISAIFQDPMTSLNPTMTIGKQIIEGVTRHQKKIGEEALEEAIELLRVVEINNPERCIDQYPHQLSGGMKQRVMVAIALACKPQLLIADEPTTSLDVTTQDQILRLLKKLQKQFGMSLLLITHDFGVVAGMSDRVVVFQNGSVLEEGTPEKIYHKPAHTYTHNLVNPYEWKIEKRQIPAEPIAALSGIKKSYRPKNGVVTAVNNVDLEIYRGETLALVGESGSGKSTLAKILLQLEKQTEGTVSFCGKRHTCPNPKAIQAIFQNPYATLDPRMRVKEILEEPFIIHGIPYDCDRIEGLLHSVGLDSGFLMRRPHAMSGGQRQRVGIARALAVEPDLLICDEPLSALDLATQRQIMNLLIKLRQVRDLTYLFITHDLSVAKALADRVAVMYMGQIVELAPAAQFFERPEHPYSKMLLASIPYRDPRLERTREVPAAKEHQLAAAASLSVAKQSSIE